MTKISFNDVKTSDVNLPLNKNYYNYNSNDSISITRDPSIEELRSKNDKLRKISLITSNPNPFQPNPSAKDPYFNVNIEDLLSENANQNPEKRYMVKFEGSFDRYSYVNGEFKFADGYKLWDKNGNYIRVENIYTQSGDGIRPDNTKDLNRQAINELLRYGKYCQIKAQFVPRHTETVWHSTVEKPPQVIIESINDIAINEFIHK